MRAEADLDRLAMIWHHGWHEAHASLVPAELTRLRCTLPNFRERLQAALPDLRVAGEPSAGFCQLKDDELLQLYVSAEARGTGVAAALIADAETRLAERGVEVAWLACAIGNQRAARFYEKAGWARAGVMIDEGGNVGGSVSPRGLAVREAAARPRRVRRSFLMATRVITVVAVLSAVILTGYFGIVTWAWLSPSNDPQRGMAEGFLMMVTVFLPLPCRATVVRGAHAPTGPHLDRLCDLRPALSSLVGRGSTCWSDGSSRAEPGPTEPDQSGDRRHPRAHPRRVRLRHRNPPALVSSVSSSPRTSTHPRLETVMTRRIAVGLVALALALPLPALARAGASDLRAQVAKLEQGWQTAYNAGDAAALSALYTSDGKLLPPGAEPVSGAAAMKAFFTTDLANGAKMTLTTK